jgi:hypothetical protein
MKAKGPNPEIERLKRELEGVRRASLMAARRGDYMRTAQLTNQASSLSRALGEAEGLISLDLF